MTKVLRQKYIPDILFCVLFIAVSILLISRINYGFGGYDEMWYLTLPHRISMGDALFKDEWDLAQMMGFLIYPLFKIFLRINGGTLGIILAFRWMYTVFHGLVSVFAYSRLRKYGYLAAVGCASFFMFMPYNMMAFSYVTMPLDFLVIAGLLLSTFNNEKPIFAVVAGLCFAGTVLCCPYMVIVYVLYGIACLVFRKKNISSIFTGKVFLFFTVGAAVLAVIFLVFIFSRVTVSDFLKNLQVMLINPEYTNHSFFSSLKYYIWSIKTCHEYFLYVFIVYVVTLVIMLIDRNRDKRKIAYFIASACVTVCCYIMFTPMLIGMYYHAIEMPLIFTGLTAYILCKHKPVDIFISIFVIGILYSVCVNCASNTGIFAIATALSLASFASFLFIGVFLSEEFKSKPQKYFSVIVTIIVIVILAVLQYRVKTEYYYQEYESSAGKEPLTYEMQGGPADGIYTSFVIYADYQRYLWDVNEFFMNHPEPDNLLVLSMKPWVYLMFDHYPYATYSAWLPTEDEVTLGRLKEYFTVNPDKIPKYVYIPKISNWNVDTILEDAQKNGYEITEKEYSWQLTKQNNE